MARRKYVINALTGAGVDEAIRGIEERKLWIERKTKELCERCAALGATVASLRFSRATYTGLNDAEVSVESIDGGYVVRADGESVLFIEFGSGVRYGGGHPEPMGFGPGTYPIPPGKGHWDDPKGWYLPKEKGGDHTFGNPPAMAMYDARKEIEQRLREIVREVFSSD